MLTLATSGEAAAQGPLTRLSRNEAVSLAGRANPMVRAKEFEHQAVGANEATAALRPNPTLGLGAEGETEAEPSPVNVVVDTTPPMIT